MLKQELQKLVAFKADMKKRTSAGQQEFEKVCKKLRAAAETGMLVCDIEVVYHTNKYFRTGPILISDLESLSLELYDRLINEGLTVKPHIVRDMTYTDIDSDDYVTMFMIGWE